MARFLNKEKRMDVLMFFSFLPTRWCPPSYKLVYNPMKTVDISPTKTVVIGVINQLSYRTGTPPCRPLKKKRWWTQSPPTHRCQVRSRTVKLFGKPSISPPLDAWKSDSSTLGIFVEPDLAGWTFWWIFLVVDVIAETMFSLPMLYVC